MPTVPDAVLNILKEPLITDWLMLIVTTVYAVTTFFILRANRKSALIAKEQLEDSQQQVAELKRQNEEARRLEFLPYLQMQPTNGSQNVNLTKYDFNLFSIEDPGSSKSYHLFKLLNIGNGPAANIRFNWESNLKIQTSPSLFDLDAIMNGDACHINFIISCPRDLKKYLSGTLIFTYTDLIGHRYTQLIKISYTLSGEIIFTNKVPELR